MNTCSIYQSLYAYVLYNTQDDGVEDCDTEYQFPFDPAWELDRDRLRIQSLLGEGQFGRVMYATLDCGESEVPVAVKVSVILFYSFIYLIGKIIHT